MSHNYQLSLASQGSLRYPVGEKNPENELDPNSRIKRLEMLAIELGICPLKLLLDKVRDTRFGSPCPIVDGRGPESLFSVSESTLIVEILNIVSGTLPARLLR